MFKARQLSHLISPLPAAPRSVAACEEGWGKIPETSRSRPHFPQTFNLTLAWLRKVQRQAYRQKSRIRTNAQWV